MLNLLWPTLVLATPLILAAMAGYTSERGGVINIGLEGMMLASACTAALVSVVHGAALGLLAGVGAATLLSLLHWLATQHYRIDHVISGMSINALAAGGTNFLYGKFSNPDRTGSIPHFGVPIFVGLAFGVTAALWAGTKYTAFGWRLVAVGSDPAKARLAGINPVVIRLIGLLMTGVLTGLAGVMLVSDSGVFTDNMTSGRGYIALAALILGGWRCVPACLACLGFGVLSAVRLQFQGTSALGGHIPTEAWASLPYVVTVVALAGFLGRTRTPTGLGRL